MVRWYDKFVLTLCILLLELVQYKEEFSVVSKESCVLSVREITRIHEIRMPLLDYKYPIVC